MAGYVTRKVNKNRELVNSFQPKKTVCANCAQTSTVPTEIPDEIWNYILRRGANLNVEQRKQIHQWDSGVLTGKRLMELMLRLDRTDTVLAQSLGTNAPKGAFWVEESVEGSHVPEVAAPKPGSEWESYLPEVYMQEDQADEGLEADDISDEDDYDLEHYDDDGLPLIDEDGEGLIPFDDQQEFDESEAVALMTFAGTYRQVRGQLQATRIGRDQKQFGKKGSFKKGSGKSKGKGRDRLMFWKETPVTSENGPQNHLQGQDWRKAIERYYFRVDEAH